MSKSHKESPTAIESIFDERLYREANPDVVDLLRRGVFRSGLDHFQQVGGSEIEVAGSSRRLPFKSGDYILDFDQDAYAEDNPDVQEMVNKGEYRSGLQHFLLTGYGEIRDGKRSLYRSRRFTALRGVLAGYVRPRQCRHVCIFAHYDVQSIIDRYVLDYLEAIRQSNLDVIFVTATNDRQELERVRPFASKIFVKNDGGRDFGSWHMVLKHLGISYFDPYDYLVLANDSVYCLRAAFRDMMKEMLNRGLNLWGATDSVQLGQYHLQSYFLALDATARAQLLPSFMAKYDGHPYLTKRGQILEYELGLSRAARQADLRCGVRYSTIDIIREIAERDELRNWRAVTIGGAQTINPTIDLWDLLVERFGLPYVKVQLLRDNPSKLGNVNNWRKVVSGRGLDADIVDAHLRRMAFHKELLGRV